MRTPRVLKILNVSGHKILSLWANGEVRQNDYSKELDSWRQPEMTFYNQLADPSVFGQVIAQDGQFTWPKVQVETDMGRGPKWTPIQFDNFQTYDEGKLIEVRREMQLAKLLFDARKASNLTQYEVAKRSGLTRQTISKIERAEIQIQSDTLITIVTAMGRKLVVA
ncbi:helix-turn-helix domain-containing protein [Spirosoma utsteinense]|uniref:DNA-binding XRE family transcriptional regulator n=1 Tax=Spirosoma utsteinense TaxID=2585773 RepID=A0ABR6WF66_9BACT|nr:helix-turn-helix transcriptional regulator [Spirosoma utsteinense]MBC3789447.1 DNA-binding XRE family transcriptional regulator [Spirosoma utsteinense]MBC3795195.1 DNA-binding XRE family transcriptional regulator [Spirosoma utsteinense]